MPSSQSAPEPSQLRLRLPSRYSWIDHSAKQRLKQCQSNALSLYLMLTLISNRHGLSYYGDQQLQALTKLDAWQLRAARQQLGEAGLIAYANPMYQVLDLSAPHPKREQQETRKTQNTAPTKPPPHQAPPLSEEERQQIVKELRELRHRIATGKTK
jgi:hypothetical protein